MPRDIKRLAHALRDYIRDLDHESFERMRAGAWLVASFGTENYLEKSSMEVLEEVQKRLPEEQLILGPWWNSFWKISREWAEINLYANESWPDKLVALYEKHGVKQ